LLFIFSPLLGDLSDPIQIDSIAVYPDPPKPGEDLTVKVKARAQDRVEVCLRKPVCFPLLIDERKTLRMEHTLMS